MRYGGALPAGSYKGPLGAYRGMGYSREDEVSHAGAVVREQTKRQVVGMAGFNGLGLSGLSGPNLCTDPGWAAAQSIVGVTGTILGTGGGAWSAAGAGITGAAGAWAAACAAEAAQRNQVPSPANQANLQAQLDQIARNTQRQIEENARANQQMIAALLASQQRQASPQPVVQYIPQPRPKSKSSSLDMNTLLIGAGVIGAAVLAAVLLRR